MKINPKIAKQPEDLQQLEFKRMKQLIKKELVRLEKNTSKESPTQCVLIGDFNYKDKPGMALPLFGSWKGKFKDYAKKEVALKEPLGAIGCAYFGGIDEDGQKSVHINLSKGKGKAKTAKINKTLKKLIPQATYNVIWGEISEQELEALDQKLDAAPEVEEVFEEPTADEMSEVTVDVDQDVRMLLISNFKELNTTLNEVKTVILPKIRAKQSEEDDMEVITDMNDLANEWLIIYNMAPQAIQQELSGKKPQVEKLVAFATELDTKLKAGGLIKDTIPSMMRPGEKPAAGMDTGLSEDAINSMFNVQGLSNNCDATSRYMVYKYLEDRGVLKMDTTGLLNSKGQLNVYDTTLNGKTKAVGNLDFEVGTIISKQDGHLQLVKEGKTKGSWVPDPNFGKAINYINKHVANGIPVVVGVSHTHRSGQGYNEGTTDHFIVIVGRKGDGYFYIDPGTWAGAKVAENYLEPVAGQAYMFTDKTAAIKGYSYVLTTVGVFNKDRGGNNDWEQDDEIDAPTLDENAPGEGEIRASVGKGGKNDYKDAIIVQNLLKKQGANLGNFGPNKDGVDGDPGDSTIKAIEKFQKDNGLSPTGLVEPKSDTWNKLFGINTGGTTVTDNNSDNNNPTNNTTTADNTTPTPTTVTSETTGKLDELVDNAPSKMIAELGPSLVANPEFQVNHGGPNGWWYDNGSKKWPPGKPIPQNILNEFNKGNSVTWCNYFVWEMSKKIFGANDPFEGKEMGAIAMVDYMDKRKDKFDELPMPADKDLSFIWRDYINKGKFVIFGGVGHVALGQPTTEEKMTSLSGWKYGNIVQAGASTGPMTLAQGFDTSNLKSIQFFVFKSEEDYVKQTQVPAIKPEDVKLQLKGSAKALNAKSEQVLRDILAKAGEANPVIVNTVRTAEEQASVMLMNIKAYGAEFNRKKYKNPKLASQVVDAYVTAQTAGKSETDILGAMLTAINQVGAQNLSDHCNAANPAIDIHPSSLKNKGIFEKIIKADPRVSVICPPADTTYHIVVK